MINIYDSLIYFSQFWRGFWPLFPLWNYIRGQIYFMMVNLRSLGMNRWISPLHRKVPYPKPKYLFFLNVTSNRFQTTLDIFLHFQLVVNRKRVRCRRWMISHSIRLYNEKYDIVKSKMLRLGTGCPTAFGYKPIHAIHIIIIILYCYSVVVLITTSDIIIILENTYVTNCRGRRILHTFFSVFKNPIFTVNTTCRHTHETG